MRITSIEKSNKNRGRVPVCVDSDYCFSVSEEDYISLNLYDMKEITSEEIENIKNNINYREAKSRAVKYLAMKIRTEREVVSKLTEEGFDEGIAFSVTEELKGIGYINDKLFVQKYLFDRSKLKPKSKRFLKLELLEKGVPEEIIDEIMEGWEAEDDSVAENLVRRKFGKYDLEDVKVKKKVYSFLSHRGFNHEIISKILKQGFED